jgi:hypothetical protein
VAQVVIQTVVLGLMCLGLWLCKGLLECGQQLSVTCAVDSARDAPEIV